MRAWVLLGVFLVACGDSGESSTPGRGDLAPASAPSGGPATGAGTSTSTSPTVEEPPPASIKLDVGWVGQNPELPRGCEVTALTMMLRHAGVDADKMKLAQEIDKVAYKTGDLFGDPNDGFVGDMYSFDKQGYGAYHVPVERLAAQYMPGKVIKLTGSSFDDLLNKYVGRKQPVWTITNARWEKLPASEMHTWNTKNGPVQMTWHEHSVVITGYDATSVYINDPLDSKKNKKLDRTKFREAWEQMGKQALAFAP